MLSATVPANRYRSLRHPGDLRAPGVAVEVGEVDAADGHPSGLRCDEAQQHVRAGWTCRTRSGRSGRRTSPGRRSRSKPSSTRPPRPGYHEVTPASGNRCRSGAGSRCRRSAAAGSEHREHLLGGGDALRRRRGTGRRPRAAAGTPPGRGSAPAARSAGRACPRPGAARSPTATSATDSVASSSSTSDGQEGHAAGYASWPAGTRSATAADRVRLARARPKAFERRQTRRPRRGSGAPAGPARRHWRRFGRCGVQPDQDHEHRDQRQGHRDDHAGEQVGGQRSGPARRPGRPRRATSCGR